MREDAKIDIYFKKEELEGHFDILEWGYNLSIGRIKKIQSTLSRGGRGYLKSFSKRVEHRIV